MVGNNTLVEIEGLCAHYGKVQCLCQVSLGIFPEEIVALVGSNGTEKTSLLHAICGVLPVTSGRILYSGQSLSGISVEDRVDMDICLVPERRRLFPTMSVIDNLVLGAYHRFSRGEKAAVQRDLALVVGQFPILGQRKRQLAGTLSGGEQQMLALARGLMARPRLMLLDEPSLGLSPVMVTEVMKIIRQLRSMGITILLSEQNSRAALKIADRGYVLENGSIAMEGTGAEILDSQRVKQAYLGNSKE